MAIIGISGTRHIDEEAARNALGWAIPRLMTRIIVTEGRTGCEPRDFGWLHGGAEGVDEIAHELLVNGRHKVPEKRVKVIRPNYEKHGQQAPFRRNSTIVKNADYLIAVWDGQSRGTADTIAKAAQRGILIVVEVVSG